MFRDYRSTYDEVRQLCKKSRMHRFPNHPLAFKDGDFESVYAFHLNQPEIQKTILGYARIKGELVWYRDLRPYFNVYPLVESKFLEMDIDLSLKELAPPFYAIEIRTHRVTFLLVDFSEEFYLIIVEMENDEYQEIVFWRKGTLRDVLNGVYREVEDDKEKAFRKGSKSVGKEERNKCILIAAGTCLLANDKSIVTPVILNKHRKESMSPAEIAEYAAKAVSRSGRLGFDVGRDIERKKAFVHYRNGCFAKYYVGKTHECYPVNAEADKVPIIKWRCGSIVNRDNVPPVPTGFKDK